MELLIPRYNANDDICLLLEWLVPDGATVRVDDCVATVETAKAVHDLMSPSAGALRHGVPEGTECSVGMSVGWVGAAGSAAEAPVTGASAGDPGDGLILTRAARDLVVRHGVTSRQLMGLSKAVVQSADVERLLEAAGRGPARGAPAAGGHQRGVAATVIASHRDIPAAYLAVDVPADVVHRERTRGTVVFGMAEVLLTVAGRLARDHPRIFQPASVGDDDEAVPVAVTLDAGHGLFTPVIAARVVRSGVAGVAVELMRLGRKAARGRFAPQELTGGALLVSLNDLPGVVAAVPLIHPEHRAALALTATREVPVPDGGSAWRTGRVVTIGLAYDHRHVNGRDAAAFLHEVSRRMQDPAFWTDADGR